MNQLVLDNGSEQTLVFQLESVQVTQRCFGNPNVESSPSRHRLLQP